MSISTVSSGDVLVVTPADLDNYLEESKREALERHRHSIRAILEVAGVRFFDKKDHYERAADFRAADPLVLLGDKAVKSVMLEQEVFHDDIDPLDTSYGGYNGDWRIKTHDDPFGSGVRFFVAKAPFAELPLEDGETAQIIQRRTYAAVAVTGGQEFAPREVDVRQALGVASRHSADPRGDVLVAPTSVSLYARKPDQVSDL